MTRRRLISSLALACTFLVLFASASFAKKTQIQTVPFTVNVFNGAGSPIRNAGVVIRQISQTGRKKLKGALHIELKTDQHGNATSDLFEAGVLEIQVIAEGYQTWGAMYGLQKPGQIIRIRLETPKPQISIYK